MNTEINILVVIGILFIHWFADFVCQTDKQAKRKSISIVYLLAHTANYSMWFLAATPLYLILTHSGNWWLFLFTPITFLCHTITDYFTSRLNSRLYAAGRTHDFFVSVGFDQLLHFAQLLITFQLLK